MIDESHLRACPASNWALPGARVGVNHGGMGSATWLVSQAGRRWVAKAVTPALRAPFTGGLSVATLLDEAGIPAGAPVPTLDGRSVVDLDAASLALLTWVEGEPLTGSGAGERQVIGETLALANQALQGASVPGAQRFHWVRPDADHLALDPGSAPRPPPPSPPSTGWTQLPSPGAGSTPTRPPSTSGWTRPADAAASSTGASPWRPAALRPRVGGQADYFARRIANHDLTGITGPAGNEKGLEDARRRLG